jgi:hypothetical protein
MKLDFKGGYLVYLLVIESIQAIEANFNGSPSEVKKKECVDAVNAGFDTIAYQFGLNENISNMIKATLPDFIEVVLKSINGLKGYFDIK